MISLLDSALKLNYREHLKTMYTLPLIAMMKHHHFQIDSGTVFQIEHILKLLTILCKIIKLVY